MIMKKYLQILAIISVIGFWSCGQELLIPIPEPTFLVEEINVNDIPMRKISGLINKEFTLVEDSVYLLDGLVTVAENNVLTIEPGTLIYVSVDNVSGLVLERKAKIDCEGTQDKPIVFTSLNKINDQAKPGDWYGVHINGQAALNSRTSILVNYIGKYGRTDEGVPEDDSGVFSFVRIEFAGKEVAGVSGAFNLNGLGSASQIDHVQVYQSSGNGIRIRGGTVSMKYLIANKSVGTGIRWDNGWTGNGQFWISEMLSTDSLSTTCLRGGSNSVNELPVSSPNLSNLSIISDGAFTTRGIRLRDFTQAGIFNSIIYNTNRGLRVDTPIESLSANEIVFQNNSLFLNETTYFDNSTSNASFFAEQEFNNIEEAISLDGLVGSSNTNPLSLSGIDPWFDEVFYRGAINGIENDWTLNWVKK